MEVIREMRLSPSLSLPQQDAPVDLTKGNQVHESLFHSYGFEASLQESAFPHLRLNGRITSVLRKGACEQTHSSNQDARKRGEIPPPVEFNSSQRESTPLPKKRRLLDAETSQDFPTQKRQKHEPCYPHLDLKRPLSPLDYSKDAWYPPHTRSYISCQSYSEKPEDPLHFSSVNCPVPPQVYDSSLMDRIVNPQRVDSSPESIKETENLLAAVQHSQMLYYSYCTQLLQNLQTRRLIQEQEQLKKYSEVRLQSPQTHLEGRPQEEKVKVAKEDPVVSREVIEPRPVRTTAVQESDAVTTTTSLPQDDYFSIPTVGTAARFSPKHQWLIRTNSLDSIPTGAEPLHPLHTRKRAPRALTGKHVRPGTGASPSTLLTLRQKVAERLKTKDEGTHPAGKRTGGAGGKESRPSRGRKR